MLDKILWRLAVVMPSPINSLFTNLWKRRNGCFLEKLKEEWCSETTRIN